MTIRTTVRTSPWKSLIEKGPVLGCPLVRIRPDSAKGLRQKNCRGRVTERSPRAADLFGFNVQTLMREKEKEVATRVKLVILELQHYASSHRIDDESGKNLDAVIAAGALSPRSVAFVQNNKVQFFGFNSAQVSGPSCG